MNARRKILAAALSVLICISGMQAAAYAEGGEPGPASQTSTDGTGSNGQPDGTGETTGGSTEQPNAPVSRTAGTIYVKDDGNDETNDGSEKLPYASLAKAVKEAASGDTIVLLSSITVDECARIEDKVLTIDGQGNTVTRADTFDTIDDGERSWYNPALIEVTTPNEQGAELRLVNITLNDAGKHMGTVFSQQTGASSGATGYDNTTVVQDAIVSAYGTDNATASIILGSGAYLTNYGGESAVRVTKGGSLTMESGSAIFDTMDLDRSEPSGSARYGAVWVQTASCEIRQGAEIRDMKGRGIFLENGATALVNGTIRNITNATGMKNGSNGVAIYAFGTSEKGHSVATLGPTGRIESISGTQNDNDGAVSLQYSCFTSSENSVITGVTGTAVVYANDSRHEDGNGVYLGGIVESCESTYLFRPRLSDFTLEETGIVRGCSTPAGGVSIFYSTDGAAYYIKGTVTGNTAERIFYIALHQVTPASMTIEPTAKITDNDGNAVYVTNGSTVTMNGGVISGNEFGIEIKGKTQYEGTSFRMNGGTITGNQAGAISYTVAGGSVVELNGGEISGNGTSYQIFLTGGSADNTSEYLLVKPGVLIGNTSILADEGLITLDEEYDETSLGTASSQALARLKELIGQEHATWTTVGSKAIWVRPTEETLHFRWIPAQTPSARGLYAAYIPLDEDGAPAAGAEVQFVSLENTKELDLTLEGLTPGTAYAVMLVNNDIYTLLPDRISIYTGGSDYETTGGLPEDYTLAGLDAITELEVDGVSTSYGADEASQTQAMNDLKALLTVRYTDGAGNVLEDDSVPGEYTASIAWNNTNTVVKINGNNTALQDGVLIIRPVTEPEKADQQEDDVLFALESTAPTQPVEHSVAVANSNSVYTVNGDPDRELTDTSALALLDDDLLTQGDDNRRELLESRGNEMIQWDHTGSDLRNEYEFHYLDLVDPNTGNAWVAASEGVDIYLPYPEGTDQSTEFRLLHYKDLHREYGIEGQANVEQAIRESEIEQMSIVNTENGILFHVDAAGFSPFALVWQTANQAPTITASDRTIAVGDVFDALQGVTASDPEDGDLTGALQVAFSNVDTQKAGSYTVMFRVTDRQGATAEKTITVTVVGQSLPTDPGTSDTPASGGTPVNGSAVQTGDASQPAIWAALAVLSGVLAALLVWKRRSRDRTQ